MARKFTSVKNLRAFLNELENCKDEVWLYNRETHEGINLKSKLAQYLNYEKLMTEWGDKYEIQCKSPTDEGRLLKFYYD